MLLVNYTFKYMYIKRRNVVDKYELKSIYKLLNIELYKRK